MKLDDLYSNDQDTLKKWVDAVTFNRLRPNVDVDGIEVDADDEFQDKENLRD